MARNPVGIAIEAFPLALIGAGAGGFAWSVVGRTPWPMLGALAVLYLLPPLLHRLHDRFAPLEPGVFDVVGEHYLPWWGSHQLQLLFIAFPAFETVLRLVPGAYSAWLRLWGARVGRGVYWTPGVRIYDRSLLEVGDGVVFGEGTGLTAHGITHSRGRLRLILLPIRIGDGALLGARCGLSPGAEVEAGAVVPALTVIGVRERWKKAGPEAAE